MFAIYTPNGRTFSGLLEDLYRVQKTDLSQQTRNYQEIDDFSNLNKGAYTPHNKAIAAYDKTINTPKQKELICHAFQVMTTNVEAISAGDSLEMVIEKFKLIPYQEFPIINNQQQLIGRLSRQQLYEYILKNGGVYKNGNKTKNVAQLFLDDQSKVYAAEPVTDIRRIAILQVKENLHTIPILENNGRMVGIISRTDIIKAITMDPPLSLWC